MQLVLCFIGVLHVLFSFTTINRESFFTLCQLQLSVSQNRHVQFVSLLYWSASYFVFFYNNKQRVIFHLKPTPIVCVLKLARATCFLFIEVLHILFSSTTINRESFFTPCHLQLSISQNRHVQLVSSFIGVLHILFSFTTITRLFEPML